MDIASQPITQQTNSLGEVTVPPVAQATSTPAPVVPPVKVEEEVIEDINLSDIFIPEEVKPPVKEGEEEPDDEALKLQQQIENSTAPLREKVRTSDRLRELDELLSSPEGKMFAKFKGVLQKAIVDKQWGNMKTPAIVASALGVKRIAQIGAEIERQARAKQSPFESSGKPKLPEGSGSNKPFTGENAMTPQEFKEYNEKFGMV